MAQEKFITRRVVKSTLYNIYKVDGTKLILIDQKEFSGRISEKELAKEYNVDKVVTTVEKVNKAVYGVPVDQFMKIAQEIKKEEN